MQNPPMNANTLFLPRLRQDLQILPSSTDSSGQPSWLLFDPLRNKYFKMGTRALAILRHWRDGINISQLLDELHQQGLASTQDEVLKFIHFLTVNFLLSVSSSRDSERLCAANSRSKPGVLKWLLHHYLFFRIPLVKPDRFLNKTLPIITPVFSAWLWPLICCFGLIGLFLASRQWETFRTTFLYFFDRQGLLLFGITTIVVKTLHELGHAYTAKHYGCTIPVMGVAFMVFYPMLFTDTSDAWRLSSHQKRMQIALAGIKVEFALACLGIFMWGFLDDGFFRSVAWFVTSVSIVSSLLINLSPLMRYDGYYVLSDWLGEENLQFRAFALARWHLRRILFGNLEELPEQLPRTRHWFFIGYAWTVWIYRFFLFLGIAVLVYHYAFKALGIMLFCVEIIWFIFLPIWREVATWTSKGYAVASNLRRFGLLCLVLFPFSLLLIPWHNSVLIPAVWKAAQQTQIFSPENSQITAIFVRNGQSVEAGQKLFELDLPDLDLEEAQQAITGKLLKELFERHTASSRELKGISMLRARQHELLVKQKALEERKRRLVLVAPFSGIIEVPNTLHEGVWVSHDLPLGSLIHAGHGQIVAFADREMIQRISPGMKGKFIPVDLLGSSCPVTLVNIDAAAISNLAEPALTSVNKGPIAVRATGMDQNILRPEKELYRLELSVDENSQVPNTISPGIVKLSAHQVILAKILFQSAFSAIIKELSF